MRPWRIGLLCASQALAQEAESGFELRATVSAMGVHSPQLSAAPRRNGPYNAGLRAVLYPAVKISRSWAFAGAVQIHTRPYFSDELATQGRGVATNVLQGHLAYSRFWDNRSVLVRVGQLSTAFGSFLLRYDDAVNPLIDLPPGYGYYRGVTNRGLLGAQVDVTVGPWDARAQFVNSSPLNRRGIFDKGQFGSWAGGAGYTIRQGLRVGVSAFRGPYLHRQHRFYRPGEADPRDLPGSGYGVDVEWGRGGWNAYGELHRTQLIYRRVPNFNSHSGYGEVRRVLHPRWYAASRISYVRPGTNPGYQIYEGAVGFRPNAFQLIKVGYEARQGRAVRGTQWNIFAVQLVTTFRAVSVARN